MKWSSARDSIDIFLSKLSDSVFNVTADSRQVVPGTVFVAVTGDYFDGHNFIPQVIQNGAIAVVGERDYIDADIPYLATSDSRYALAYLSSWLRDFPSRKLVMIGVTGTDGKTTTANLIYSILSAAGIKAGLITTVNAMLGSRSEATGLHVTTPDAPAVQSYLLEMVDSGLTHCVLETTSHGLVQHRVSECDFDIAVLTNVTHEHLDYHGDYLKYLDAKALLFEGLASSYRKESQPKVAVLNADDESYGRMAEIKCDRTISYSLYRDASLHAKDVQYSDSGTTFDIVENGNRTQMKTSLIGAYNVSNALAAIGAVRALVPEIPVESIQSGLIALDSIPGRMQRIDRGQSFDVIVDFAHTPNALQNAVRAARAVNQEQGRIITVFGSAGLRDVAKRKLMAQISQQEADLTILTAEDPRTESLDSILATMAKGCIGAGGKEGETFFREPDRMRAIYIALTKAQPGDTVLICGKGHEQSLCIGETEYPWDDREAAHKALDAFLSGNPSPRSGLPTDQRSNSHLKGD
ncbi:MAG: UDP-N-acetylmuramoyl-L-alanyl-D-glutamate--2,6-diaminopimelate ligase [Chloroflexota bacterium]